MRQTTHKLLSTVAAACLLFGTTNSVFAQTEFAGSLNTVSISDAAGTNKPPTAVFTYSQIENVFTFDASSSTDPDGSITDYTWDFGDGTKANGQISSHEFDTTSNAQIALTITDNAGGIAITYEALSVVTTCSVLFYDDSSSSSNTYKTSADDYYAYSGGRWTGGDKRICGAEFYIASVTGDISPKRFTIKVFATDASNDLTLLKGTSNIILGSSISKGWTGIVQFPTPVYISKGDAIVLTEENNLLDNLNYIVLGENTAVSGNFDEGIWGGDFADRRLWPRAVSAKLYE